MPEPPPLVPPVILWSQYSVPAAAGSPPRGHSPKTMIAPITQQVLYPVIAYTFPQVSQNFSKPSNQYKPHRLEDCKRVR